MDIKIENGDMVLDETGNPVYIDASDEVLQQALFILSTKKGAFIYNKDMGVEAVTCGATQRTRKNIESKLREALMGLNGVSLYLTDAEELIDGRVKAQLTLTFSDKEIDTEVILDADI